MSKILTLTATGLAGLVLGAGIGVAAAGQEAPPTTRTVIDAASMDEMHATMRDQMPAELVEQCDQMHAAMGEDHGSMMGTMGSVMDGGMPDGHAAHHAGVGE